VKSENGNRKSAALRAQLARVDRLREQVAKAWLVDVILGSPLAEVERMPMSWVTGDLPDLISDVLTAIGEDGSPHLSGQGLERAARLAELRPGSAPTQLTREISSLQTALLATLHDELPSSEPQLFAESAQRLSSLFGLVSGTATEALFAQSETGRDPLTGLQRPAQMRLRLDQLFETHRRYGHPFALVLLDIEGPGARGDPDDPGQESVLAVVTAAMRESVRLVDEAYRLEHDELCILAPDQTTADGMRMGERLAQMLQGLESAGGMRITVSAGVVSCPEHGTDAERMLRQADTGMWRARATGKPAAVGGMQDRSQIQ
jgi:diguanylate cyclase (GGDEF)-like protein